MLTVKSTMPDRGSAMPGGSAMRQMNEFSQAPYSMVRQAGAIKSTTDNGGGISSTTAPTKSEMGGTDRTLSEFSNNTLKKI